MKTTIYMLEFMLLLSLALATDDLYNMTPLDNTNNFYEYAVELNTLGSGIIGYAIILIVFFVGFGVNYGNTGTMWGGLSAGSFIAGVSAVILLPLNLLDQMSFIYIAIIAFLSFAISFLFARG